MRFKPQLFALWVALPLWRAMPTAQIPVTTDVLLAEDCHKPSQVGAQQFRVSVAATPAQQEKGLSHRKNPLAPGEGMLFWFDPPRPQAVFWMKDTWIPLTLLYFDWDGKLIDQLALKVEADPTHPKTLYPSKPGEKAVGFALEVAADRKFASNVRLCLPKKTD